MKIITLGFQNHPTAKAEIAHYIRNSFEEGSYKAKARISKKGNITGIDIYHIGSSARIHEIDLLKGESYAIHRNKRIETYAILTAFNESLFNRWNAKS